MATIDDKIVAMHFESGKFQTGVSLALTALDKLRGALNFKGASQGLDELQKNTSRFSLAGIAEGVDHISNKFSALGVVAFTVIQNLTNAALSFGKKVISAIFDPIVEGGRQRAINIEQAKFQFRGLGQDVEKSMASALEAVTGTAYGLDVAAKAAAQFGAAGIEAGAEMTGALRGVAGIAALTNSSFDDISQIFTTMAGAGKINSQQLYQFATRGINIAASLAKEMGKTEQEVRQMVSEGKISFEDFAKSMDNAFGKHAQSANKTFTGALANMRAALARIGADIWTPVLESQRLVFNALSPLIDKTKAAFQPLIDAFGKASLKGAKTFVKFLSSIDLTALTESMPNVLSGIKNIFSALGQVLGSLKGAFQDIFPAKTGQDLLTLTQRFSEFTEKLKPSEQTIENLRRTFRGFFALLDIGKMIIFGIVSVLGRMLGALSGGNGGILKFTGSIGDFIVAIRNALKSGNAIGKFFDGLGTILALPIKLISTLAGAIGGLFGTKTSGGFSDAIGGIGTALSPVERSITGITKAWTDFTDSFGESEGKMTGFGDAVANIFTSLGEGLSNINWSLVLAGINTGLFAGLVLLFKNFFGQTGGAGGILSNISGSFESISGAFAGLEGAAKSLQQNIKAKTLKEIAIAIGILALSIFLLSTIEPKKLQNAMTALTVAFGLLIGAMALLDAATKMAVVSRLPIIAGALILLAGAMVILSLAVKVLSTMSWEELAKGLGSITALLIVLTAVAGPLGQSSAGLVRAGVGIAAIGVAMNILAMAIKAFGSLSWTELGKGMLAVATALVLISKSAKLFPPNMIAIGAGLVLIGAGLKIIADAVAQLGAMSLETLGKGLGGIVVALVGIAGAMHIMPKGMLLQAAALLAISVALNLIAKAVSTMGGMSITEIAKGLGTLAGSLIILAGGLALMSGAMGGAIALSVAASGLALLVPVLVVLGKQSWSEIVKGLVSLGAALGVIGIAAVLLGPAIPAMLGLGAALILIGGGLALAGAGIALVGVGLSAIAIAGPAAVAILVGAITDLLEKLPIFVEDLVATLLTIVESIADAAPAFVVAIVKILAALSVAIVKAMPHVVKAFDALVKGILKALVDNAPDFIAAGLTLLLSLLTGIKDNISSLATAAIEVITTFLKALGSKAGEIVKAGLGLIVDVVKGIADGISKVITAGADIIIKFVSGLGKNAKKIVDAAGKAIAEYVKAIGKNAKKIIDAGADAIIDFVTGLGKNAKRIVTAAGTAMGKFIKALGVAALEVATVAGDTLLAFLTGIRVWLEGNTELLVAEGVKIAAAIVKGVVKGLTDPLQLGKVVGAVKKVADIPGAVLGKLWKFGSPSKVTQEMGEFLIQGLVIGLDKTAPNAFKSAENMSRGIIGAVEKIFGIDSPSKVMMQLGKWVSQGFADGITGSVESVTVALGTLNEKLVNAMNISRETIAEHKAKLKKLQAADEKDAKLIKKAQDAIKTNEALLDLARAAHKALTKGLTKERGELFKLAKEFENVSEKLEAAKVVLENAKQARDDAVKSFSEPFGETPEIDFGDEETPNLDPLGTYMQDLQNQVTAVATYADTLEQLRKLGLSDRTYRKLLEEGTADQQFASQLLAGGKTAVDGLNVLDAQLDAASQTLGNQAAINLYQAGVDAAKGLVDGLASQRATIVKQMSELATAIVKAIKKKLKIKSPSEVFKEVGTFAVTGLARGLTASSKLVTDAAENVGSSAIDAMKKTMSGLSDALTSEIDSQPMITPVLDLSKVRQDARSMADILDKVPMTADASYGLASSISTERTAAEIDQTVEPVVPAISFEQNNYSPEALSAIEIYRRTRNQLAQAQLALA